MAQSNKQLALLKNNLCVPMVVRDLLNTSQEPSAETNYALHEMMGNYQPEMALLCSAFVMKEIINHENIKQDDVSFLDMECERIIERYSARDDLAQENPELWQETQIQMIGEIAEDLDGFIDLISLCKLSFEITAPHIAQILEIFDVQLQCQLMIIDEVTERLSNQEKSKSDAHAVTGYDADNIIMFPSMTANR